MGAVGGMLGLSGGAGGTGFSGPAAANITNPTNAQQIGTAYTGAQNSLQQQNSLLSALQGQNGLNNQNQVYSQLQGVVNGTGPNPAQAQLAQATGANSANQAALMAGQRGAGSNVGLMARQAAMQGGANQQNAAGQAATLQANQSLNALGQAGSMANTQASNLVGQTNANTQAQQSEQGALLGAQAGYNANQVASQASQNTANAALASETMKNQAGMLGGVMNGLGAVMGAEGGQVRKFADGGAAFGAAPISKFGQFLKSSTSQNMPSTDADSSQPMTSEQQLKQGSSNLVQGIAKALTPSSPAPTQIAGGPMDNPGSQNTSIMAAARGGMVPALVSKGETYLPPEKVDRVVKGGKNPLKEGEKIPGKPKYPGNDYRNDVVPKNLKEGGVVIPNAVMQSADPAHEAYKFVQSVVAKRKVRH